MIELLIGAVLTTLVCPFLGSILAILGIIVDNRFRGYYSFLASVYFSLVGYFFIPRRELDLTRYFKVLQQYQVSPPRLIDIIQTKGFFSGSDVIFKFLSQFNNVQLLPALVGLFVYFSFFYISADFFSLNKVSRINRTLLLIIGIFIFPLAAALSNVRNILAVSILALALYRDLVKKNKNWFTVIIYLIGSSIHMAVVIIIFIRLLLLWIIPTENIFRNRLQKVVTIVTGILVVIIPSTRAQLLQVIGKGNAYATNYDTDYVAYIGQSSFMLISKILYMGFVVFLLYVTVKVFSLNKSEFNTFCLILTIFTLLTFSITIPIYMRFIFMLFLILVPIVVQYFNIISINETKNNMYFNIFIGLIIIVVLITNNYVVFNQYSSFAFAVGRSVIFSFLIGVN